MLLHVADWEQSFSPEAHSLKSTDAEISQLLADYLVVTLITLNFQNVAFETQKVFVNTFSALRCTITLLYDCGHHL